MIRRRWLSSAVAEPFLGRRRRVVGSVRSDIRIGLGRRVPPVYGPPAAEYQCLEDNARKSQAAGLTSMDRRNAFSADSHERLARWAVHAGDARSRRMPGDGGCRSGGIVRERGVQSRRVRPGSVGPASRNGPPAPTRGNIWQAIAIVALIAATAGWTTVAVLALRPASGAVAQASPSDVVDASASDDTSSEPPVADTHDAVEMEALLPTLVSGQHAPDPELDGRHDPRRRHVQHRHDQVPHRRRQDIAGHARRPGVRPDPDPRHHGHRLPCRRRQGRPPSATRSSRPGRSTTRTSR